MIRSRLFDLPSPILLLIGTAYATQLPYNPTTILTSRQNEHIVYILRPSSASGTQAELATLDLTQPLNPQSLPLLTLYDALPFLSNTTTIPYTDWIDSGGDIVIYTGNCSAGSGKAQMWRFSVQSLSKSGSGSWTQESLTLQYASGPSTGTAGPNFLAAGIAFSSNVTADSNTTSFYAFGGVCPWSNTTADTWTSTANYTNNMLALTPSGTGDNNSKYELGVLSAQNAPIAEAGHSITPLPPTYSNQSDGSQTQQQDFLLIGGHTQNAFLNMSQIALYSLPQETWTFFPVDQPGSNGKTDLTMRQSAVQIESRSGHTAVLSDDGKSVVVFGGWVGDVNTPATPQLAVLNVGEGYGGSGPWSWSVPSSSGNGLASGAGIYGHGATILPGNVMLVVGGFNIPPPSSKRLRRRSTNSEALSNRAYLYNITSNSWLTQYNRPASETGGSGIALESKGPLSTTAQKAGLGTGLAIGAIAAIALLIFYIWYRGRLKRKREAREKEISEMSFAAHRYEGEEWDIGGIDGRGGSTTAGSMYGDRVQAARSTQLPFGDNGYLPVPQPRWRHGEAQNAQRTGLSLDIPSPTRGLRRDLSGGRGPYPYEKRRSRIHPIAEGEEEGADVETSEKQEDKDVRTSLLSQQDNDPFTDSKANTDEASSSPTKEQGATAAKQRQQQFETWQSEWQRAEQALLSAPEISNSAKMTTDQHGRESPSKSDRTTSSLSENSAHSIGSYQSGGGVLGLARALSIRSANLLSSLYNPAQISRDGSPTDVDEGATSSISPTRYRAARGRSHTTSTLSTSPTHSRPATGNSRPGTSKSSKDVNVDAYTTAKTSFADLQAQSESLLGSYRGSSSAKSELAMLPSQQRHRKGYSLPKSEPSSPVKEGKRVGWVDSVRRAFSGSAKPRVQLDTSGSHPGGHRHGGSTSSTMPIAARPTTTSIRAVSDASFWRSKRGARDWDYAHPGEEASKFPPYRDNADEAGEAEGQQARTSDDWDVERASENRVVQVMFTVPRQQLRVVNADLSERSSIVSFEERGGEGGEAAELD